MLGDIGFVLVAVELNLHYLIVYTIKWPVNGNRRGFRSRIVTQKRTRPARCYPHRGRWVRNVSRYRKWAITSLFPFHEEVEISLGPESALPRNEFGQMLGCDYNPFPRLATCTLENLRSGISSKVLGKA